MIRISDLIRENLVVLDIEVQDKSEVFSTLTCLLADSGCLASENGTDLCKRLDKREEIGSTSVGLGIAIPHAYFEEATEPLIVFSRLARPMVFSQEDPEPVDKVFLLVGPMRNNTEHLMILARLTRLLRDETFVARLETLGSGAEFLEAVLEVEKRH